MMAGILPAIMLPDHSTLFPHLPNRAAALLAMLGHVPDDDALVLGQSGPAFTAEQSASLCAWRLQYSYQHLLAIAPVWAALLASPVRQRELQQAFVGHPWLPLLQQLVPRWCEAVQRLPQQPAASTTSAKPSPTASAKPSVIAAEKKPTEDQAAALPTLAHGLRCWQQLHDELWPSLNLPPLLPAVSAQAIVADLIPAASVPSAWQVELTALAKQAGRLAALALQRPVAAEVGARTCLWQQNGVSLLRYAATEMTAVPAPSVLLVYAWVNDCTVLDLAPGQSLIAALQAQGLNVYLLDWGAAGANGNTLDTYVQTHLARAVQTVRENDQLSAVSVLGICQGGTLAMMYAALHPEQIASLSLAATPVDFHTDTDRLSAWARSPLLAGSLPMLASTQSHTPALLNLLFLQLKPFSLRVGKYLSLLLQVPQPDSFAAFLRMEHWLMAGPLLSGPGLADYAGQCYRDNRLCQNALMLEERPVALSALSMPVQVLLADHDHIVPPAASLALLEQGLADVNVERFATGHIGLLVGRARLPLAEKVAAFVRRAVGNAQA